MRHINMKIIIERLLLVMAVASTSLLCITAQAAAPGITGGASTPSFDLTARDGYISQPDGANIYTWGYGCNSAPTGFLPSTITGASCPTGSMQIPGPTLIVNQGDKVTVTLHNNLPPAAGNTSILFPGFQVCAATLNADGTCTGTTTGSPGVLAQEAAVGRTVTYTFVANTPGTHAYYSGTQGDLQVEMGLYGALIVLPTLDSGTGLPTGYSTPAGLPVTCHKVGATLPNGHPDYRLAAAAYDNPKACYEREYLFQFSEMDPRIHSQAQVQVMADKQKLQAQQCTQSTGCMVVETEPYQAAYFLINGRSMPDDMDPNYAVQYPRQPYNGNPHMHPGELTLLRIIGQGRMQHPFHEHANHVRMLARDGNLLLTPNKKDLAGPLLFTTTTTPGMAMDGIFQYTAKGLNWDVYAHSSTAGSGDKYTTDPNDPIYGAYNGLTVNCVADANGYYTADPKAPNYYEWCQDHNKPLEAHPFGQVGSGGPVTLPDPNILKNGSWYGGSPYLGPDATQRAVGSTPIPPSGTVANSPTDEAGFAFMWHSHNEREITTNNIFPGGMMMMMLIDPWIYNINEAN